MSSNLDWRRRTKQRPLFAITLLPSAGLMNTASRAFPIAAPGTEGRLVIVTSTALVAATYVGNAATYSDNRHLFMDPAGNPGDDSDFTNDRLALNNHTSPIGSTVSLGGFAVGTEPQFRIFAQSTGYNFSTGQDTGDPDGKPRARLQNNWQPEASLVSFEDSFGTLESAGGSNDLSSSFTHTTDNEPPVTQGALTSGVLGAGNVADPSFSLSAGFASPEGDQITTTAVSTVNLAIVVDAVNCPALASGSTRGAPYVRYR